MTGISTGDRIYGYLSHISYIPNLWKLGEEISDSNLQNIWLVVSIPLKNMKVSWDEYPIYYGKIKNV